MNEWIRFASIAVVSSGLGLIDNAARPLAKSRQAAQARAIVESLPPDPTEMARIRRGHAERKHASYSGIHIEPRLDPETLKPITGPQADFENQIIAVLNKSDIVPPERIRFYTEVHPILNRFDIDIHVTGWAGWIRSVTPAPGGFMVKIGVYPWLSSRRNGVIDTTTTTQYFYETWYLDARNNLTLIDLVEDPHLPGVDIVEEARAN